MICSIPLSPVAKIVALMLLITASLAGRAGASFHLMQIEQVIGGVNGDTSAQAIQLRMRGSGQNVLSAASLRAVDSAGANELLLDNMDRNLSNGALGARVLITTPNFANYTDHLLADDLAVWQMQFSVSPLAATTAIPEPHSVALAGFAAWALVVCRRSTRARVRPGTGRA